MPVQETAYPYCGWTPGWVREHGQQHLLQSPKANPHVSDGAVGAKSLTKGAGLQRGECDRESGRQGGEAESTDSTVTTQSRGLAVTVSF